jgi:hypothetical protein
MGSLSAYAGSTNGHHGREGSHHHRHHGEGSTSDMRALVKELDEMRNQQVT